MRSDWADNKPDRPRGWFVRRFERGSGSKITYPNVNGQGVSTCETRPAGGHVAAEVWLQANDGKFTFKGMAVGPLGDIYITGVWL